MLRALSGLFRRDRRVDPMQLGFDLAATAPAPATAAQLLARLRAVGLRGYDRCRLTRNRTVMVSFSGGELRVHEGFLGAPAEVLAAIATFACGRTRAQRARAKRVILGYRIERPAGSRRAPERPHPDDAPLVRQLERLHAELNARHFAGALSTVAIRVSRRMKTRLGHYSAPRGDEPAEIVISRRHIRRHGWGEAGETLLHEMIHQWQGEQGRAIDHGAAFRARARAAGITPSARRMVGPRGRPSETDVVTRSRGRGGAGLSFAP
jgi:hypothetical protein